ncbi:EamA-like transporter family protein [compost metagenome]
MPVPGVPGPVDYLYLVALAGLMSSLTYVVYFGLVARIGPTRAISVEFAVTVVAVLVGALVLKEPLTSMQLAGAGVIMAGCALVLGLLPLRRRSAAL